MHKVAAIAATVVLLAGPALAQESEREHPMPPFQPPEVLAASNVVFPIRSVAFGTVVLEVTIGETGEIQNVWAIRDIASLTAEAMRAVKTWKFKAATLDGKPFPSRMDVAFTFNPPVNNPADVPLPPLAQEPQAESQNLGFQPPQVISASFPRYPINSIAFGAVVLDITVNEKGGIEDVQVLRDVASLTPEAISAATRWRFQAGTLAGQAVSSKMGVAFVFNPPRSNFY